MIENKILKLNLNNNLRSNFFRNYDITNFGPNQFSIFLIINMSEKHCKKQKAKQKGSLFTSKFV